MARVLDILGALGRSLSKGQRSNRQVRPASSESVSRKKSVPAVTGKMRPQAFGDTIADLAAAQPLSVAERNLVAAVARGHAWKPSNHGTKRPSRGEPDNQIRAELLRILVTGSDLDTPVHKCGPHLEGAYIVGPLDLTSCIVEHPIRLLRCTFEHEIKLDQLRAQELMMTGSEVEAITGHNAEFDGHVYLDEGFAVRKGIRFENCDFNGDVYLDGGHFGPAAPTGYDYEFAKAIYLQSSRIVGALVLRDATVDGAIDLAMVEAGLLIDDGKCWQNGVNILDGFTYSRIHSPRGAMAHIEWLQTQPPPHLESSDFRPQPWEQLAQVLRNMGHSGEAAEISIAKQEQMRRAGCVGQRQPKTFPNKRFPGLRERIDKRWNPIANALTRTWHYVYGLISGYGYRPQRIVYLLFGLIVLSSFAFYAGRTQGLIGPTDARIHMHPQLTRVCGNAGDPGKAYWTDVDACPVPPEYSTFQPFLYALDVTLPLIDLHQEADWGPIVVDSQGDTLWEGRWLRWLVWFDIIIGWIASLTFVAIVSKLVDKD